MKKISITFLMAGLLLVGSLGAQSIQDGVKDLYAERYKSAKSQFEKLIASNPNNIEATYWLGQTLLEMDDVAGAKNIYSKALLSSANAPLLLVGMGQVELKENKVSEARQRFEAAITMTRGKKGDDPVILNAVGRAITETYDAKNKTGGDINYAVEKLQAAVQRDPKNAEYYVNLGDAIRKAKPGEAGGLAFQNYQKAAEANANFPVSYYRMAQLFNSQRNWDLYEKYLNDAIAKDPRFAPAYYDLYYFKLLRLDFTGAEDYAKKFTANTDQDPQNDYLRCQTLWAKKDFDGAISCAKNLVTQVGANTKARVYKLIADSYLQKKDTAGAKEFVDQYFAKVKPEELTAIDYQMKASAYSIVPGKEDSVYNAYMDGLKVDTVLENKVELLKKGAEFFKNKGQREKEGDLLNALVQLKPKPSINEMFDVGRAYYFGGAYVKSYGAFTRFTEKYPDEVFGWEWKLNNAKIIDSTKQDSIAVPDALKLLAFSEKDTAKFKKQYISAASYLALYYANKAGDKVKAIEYLKKWQNMDPVNRDAIQKNIDILSKASMRKENSSPANKGS
ncbi:MAG TPA: tetratricopeptide repeat protein [Chitinophagaceae bacterium]|nr:tetratricopeptide repeat protein [Chitinophagaceae bacterium]